MEASKQVATARRAVTMTVKQLKYRLRLLPPKSEVLELSLDSILLAIPMKGAGSDNATSLVRIQFAPAAAKENSD